MRSVWLYENSRLYENSWMRLPLKWVKMGTFPWRRANTGGWPGCCDTEGGLGVVTRDCVTPCGPWPAPTLLHITAVFTHSWQRRGHSPLVIKLNVHSHPRREKTQQWKIIQLWENPSSIKLQSLWRAMNNFEFRKLALNNLYFFSLTLNSDKKICLDHWKKWTCEM